TRKVATRIALLILLLVAANFAGNQIAAVLGDRIGTSPLLARWGTAALAVAYTVFLAIPFVPGAEIGMMLMAMHGTSIALLVYLCTVTGLSAAFVAGRLVPLGAGGRLARRFGRERIARFLDEFEAMSREERLSRLAER